LETPGRLISKGSANSMTEGSPEVSRARIAATGGVGDDRISGAEALWRHAAMTVRLNNR